jgi:hypothetical protein
MGLERFHRVAIAGMTQSGKTTFLREAIVPMLGRYIIYDPDMQFDSLTMDPQRARIVDNYDEFRRLFKGGFPRIVFQPRDEMMNDYDSRVLEFEQICEDINRLRDRPLTFIVDEIAYITFKRRIATVPPQFQLMISRREKEPHRIGVFFTTQRPKHACVDLLTQCRHIYAFKLLNKDIRYVEESFPVSIQDMMYDMEDFACIHYDVEEMRVTIEKLERKRGMEGRFTVLAEIAEGAGNEW